MSVAAVMMTPYWIVQGLRQKKYFVSLTERLGYMLHELNGLPKERPGAIWIHAVSVGEVLAGVSLARRLQEQHPERALIILTTTATGQAVARERMPFADAVIYFPFDWKFSVRCVLDAVRPAIVVILETEIWPNFLRETKRRDIPVIFVSGRISDKSIARYRKFFTMFGFYLRPFMRSVLKQPAAFLMQTEKDAQRIREL